MEGGKKPRYKTRTISKKKWDLGAFLNSFFNEAISIIAAANPSLHSSHISCRLAMMLLYKLFIFVLNLYCTH